MNQMNITQFPDLRIPEAVLGVGMPSNCQYAKAVLAQMIQPSQSFRRGNVGEEMLDKADRIPFRISVKIPVYEKCHSAHGLFIGKNTFPDLAVEPV